MEHQNKKSFEAPIISEAEFLSLREVLKNNPNAQIFPNNDAVFCEVQKCLSSDYWKNAKPIIAVMVTALIFCGLFEHILETIAIVAGIVFFIGFLAMINMTNACQESKWALQRYKNDENLFRERVLKNILVSRNYEDFYKRVYAISFPWGCSVIIAIVALFPSVILAALVMHPTFFLFPKLKGSSDGLLITQVVVVFFLVFATRWFYKFLHIALQPAEVSIPDLSEVDLTASSVKFENNGVAPSIKFLVDLFSIVINFDGVVAPEEVRIIVNFFKNFDQNSGFMVNIKDCLNASLKQKPNIESTCHSICSHFSKESRTLILGECYNICIADHPIIQDEVNLLNYIAANLQIPKIEFEKSTMNSNDNEIECAFKILGIPISSTAEDIRKAYKEKAKKMHPDRVNEMDSEIVKFAQMKFVELQNAYEKIMMRHKE